MPPPTSLMTPPHLYAQLRPDSPSRPQSPPSFTPSHKRRKSSVSSDIERRPKKGDEDYIKRPENAFILFRRQCCEDRQAEEEAAKVEGKKPRQADLSKTISQMWKSLPSEERQKWEHKAKAKKKEHEQLYPNYVYRPQRAKDKDGKTKPNARKPSLPRKADESASLSFVVPVARPHGRSASAPTPPPYQSIQIPNVYHLTPSCPTSPSLLPMISRRSAHPGHPGDFMADFDYKPSSNYVPPALAVPNQLDANIQVSNLSKSIFRPDTEYRLQSSEFLRNMFTSGGHRPSESSLHHLTIGSSDAVFLPSSNSLVSPVSSTGSSGPSSPSTGPYTPASSLLAANFAQFSSGDAALDAQAQAEMDLQLEMQMQQEFANFSWGDNNSVWSSEPTILLEDDFDINSIPPIELGMSKYQDNHPLGMTHSNNTGLEFGQEFANAHYRDNIHSGALGFDELMAGHSF